MARTSGVESAGLAGRDVVAQLAAEPTAFSFFAAVRLLERLYKDRARVGGFGAPAGEVVRFSVNPSVAFPVAEIADAEQTGDGPVRLTVNFMGLIGPLGVLPYQYTLLVAERRRARDRALQAFFDLFQHRSISLFYRAWEKHRFTVAYERDGTDRVTEHLLDLVGLGLSGFRQRMPVPDEALVFYAGALAPQPRAAVALEHVLADFLGVSVQIDQFIGGWYRLEAGTQCRVGEEALGSDQLGLGAVVGDEIWDQQARVRIRLGPLTRTQYESLLPTGRAYPLLKTLTRFFSHDQFEFEVQLVLAKDELPTCRLGAAAAQEGEGEPARLGWGTWLRTRAAVRDGDETLLTL